MKKSEIVGWVNQIDYAVTELQEWRRAQEEKAAQPAKPPIESVKDKRTCFTVSRDKINALRCSANLLSIFSMNSPRKIDKEISDSVNGFYRDMFIIDAPQPALKPEHAVILRDLRDRIRGMAGASVRKGQDNPLPPMLAETLEVLDQIFGGEA